MLYRIFRPLFQTAYMQDFSNDSHLLLHTVLSDNHRNPLKSLFGTLKKYKQSNCKSNYLSDYSSAEKKVFQNAVCGKKGKYVWYIAMSSSKKSNNKGQTAIKKNI